MQDIGHTVNKQEINLTSPVGTPFGFRVSISEEKELNKAGSLIEVTAQDPITQLPKTCQYSLNERDHNAYLNFFEKLATDYGLRLPQNRRQAAVKPAGKVPLREVLGKNLTPDIRYGYGDPAVIRVEEGPTGAAARYYLLATSNDAPHSFPILRSRNLLDWELVGFVFPPGKKPAWAADGELISDYWAPEMHQVGNEFRVYFVARDKNTRELCIGMARSAHPEGPFIPDPEPVLRGNVIDPHLFVQDNETAFLYWKEDNNDVWPGKLSDLLYENPGFIPYLFEEREDQLTASFILTLWPWARILEPMERFLVTQILIEAVIARFLAFFDRLTSLIPGQPPRIQEEIRSVLQFMKTPMYAQQLSPDGSGLVGERTKIIENDLAWEAHLVEGMWVTHYGTKYYLFYAGNDFSTDQYGIGVAIADAPLGPYRKLPQPFLQSTAEWWAPGHPSVVMGPDGHPVLFLHAYLPRQAGYKQFRAVLAVPITFMEDRVLLV